jgi:hypothetical protein
MQTIYLQKNYYYEKEKNNAIRIGYYYTHRW